MPANSLLAGNLKDSFFWTEIVLLLPYSSSPIVRTARTLANKHPELCNRNSGCFILLKTDFHSVLTACPVCIDVMSLSDRRFLFHIIYGYIIYGYNMRLTYKAPMEFSDKLIPDQRVFPMAVHVHAESGYGLFW